MMDFLSYLRKVKKISKTRIVCIIIFTILLFVAIIKYGGDVKSVVEKDTDYSIQNDTVVGPIGEETIISQTFIMNKNFDGIKVLMANYACLQKGNINVVITNESNDNVIYDEKIETEKIKDNSYYTFALEKKEEITNRTKFRIDIMGEKVEKGTGITVWRSNKDQYQDGELYINNEKQNADIVFKTVDNQEKYKWGVFIKRIEVLGLVYVFLLLNCFFDFKVLYGYIYKYRVWIAIGLFVFCVANQFNFSSINQWDNYVQTGSGSEYVEPIFGKSRAIRSDEWLVDLPRAMSAEYVNYGKINDIVRATKTSDLSASGLYLSYSALAKPAEWGYYLFGTSYGVSFFWSFRMIFGFLIMFEFIMLLTKQNKFVSIMGAVMIWFSSYNMWWASALDWMMEGCAALVLAGYFLKLQDRKKRIIFGLGIAVATSNFIVDLYPAWMVPAGYVFLVLLIWLIIKNISVLKRYTIKDWIIVVVCLSFMCSIVGTYLYNYMDYIKAITKTVYPGKRIGVGGFSLIKLLGYFSSFFSSFVDYQNPCEMGCFYGVFPVGIVVYILALIKKGGRSLLMWLLMIPAALLTPYCLTEIPERIAKITLLSYTVPERAVDILGFLMVLYFLIGISELENDGLDRKIGLIVCTLSVGCAVLYEKWNYMSEKRWILTIVLAIFTTIYFTCVISKVNLKLKKCASCVFIGIIFVDGIAINPLMSGVDAITSKPMAKEVNKIVQENRNAKWITTDGIIGNYLIACGAPTYNSVNYIPNYEFWKKIDPQGNYEEDYNRYAHVGVNFTDENTSVELLQEDSINLNLSYNDLNKIDVTYIASRYPIDEEKARVKKIYEENGMCIYKKIYR